MTTVLNVGDTFPDVVLPNQMGELVRLSNLTRPGQLDEMLERAAHNQELEVDTIISAVMGVLGPALILMMAGIVLTIVLAIMLPIFDMNQLVQ